MNKVRDLYVRYKDIILYIIFGVLSTLVNFISYWILSEASLFPKEINTVTNTWIAWFISVVFAYVTNRKWVFASKVSGVEAVIGEMATFFACRLATGAMDSVIMYIFVDKVHINDKLVKLASNVLVVILNYIGSKLFVFKKKENNS